MLNAIDMTVSICGPGATSCLTKIFGSEVDSVFGEALAWLHEIQDLHFAPLDISHERRPCISTPHKLLLVDFEHSLCECDVYSRKAHPNIKGHRLHIAGKCNFSADRPSAVLPREWLPVELGVLARACAKCAAPPPVDLLDPVPSWERHDTLGAAD